MNDRDRDDFYRYLWQLKAYEETEARERRRLADELVKRRLVPPIERDARDPLATALFALRRSLAWEKKAHELRMQYPHAGPKLLGETLALIAIHDHDHEATARRLRILEAEQKEKKQAQARAKPVTVKQPAGRIIRKTFHNRTHTPSPGETESEFLERCIADEMSDGADRDEAEQTCEIAWARRRATAAVNKATKDGGIPFVLSTEEVDRAGDVIVQRGWRLDSFAKNSPCLFAHQHDFVVGRWSAVHVANNALLGTLHLAPEGISDRVTEVIRLVEHGLLKSVSVGFRALRTEPRRDSAGAIIGTSFLEQDLIECSLTPCPCNPGALAVARQLGVSRSTMELVFKESRHAR